jgi:hypothetical protein
VQNTLIVKHLQKSADNAGFSPLNDLQTNGDFFLIIPSMDTKVSKVVTRPDTKSPKFTVKATEVQAKGDSYGFFNGPTLVALVPREVVVAVIEESAGE